MQNVNVEVKGNKLVLTADLTGTPTPSSSGKTKLIASTRGAVPITHPKLDGLKAALNVTVPA